MIASARTALTPPWSPAAIPDQSGRVAVVTGASSGLGLHTALGLARAGASVVLACRDAGAASARPRRSGARCPRRTSRRA